MISILQRVAKLLTALISPLIFTIKSHITPQKYNLRSFITAYKFLYQNFFSVFIFLNTQSISKLNFLPVFYARNNLMWADGFLIDFLQKKTVDLLTRKFFLFTGFLFSERFIFEIIVKLYLDTLVWPLHALSLFEAMNTIELLANLIAFYFLFFSFLVLLLIVI